jgi:hypothetical protein
MHGDVQAGVSHGLSRGGEPAGIAQERPDDRRHQRPGPIQFLLQDPAARLVAGERRDLRAHHSRSAARHAGSIQPRRT